MKHRLTKTLALTASKADAVAEGTNPSDALEAAVIDLDKAAASVK